MLPPQGFVASRATSIEMQKTTTEAGAAIRMGSLERNQSVGAYDTAKVRSYRGGGGSLERNGGPPMGILGNRGGGSLERNSGYNYNYYKSQLKQPCDTEPFQEEIYDFGGANVKSCASIALKKSIAKGIVPPEYFGYMPLPPPYQHPPNVVYQQSPQLSSFRPSEQQRPLRQWPPMGPSPGQSGRPPMPMPMASAAMQQQGQHCLPLQQQMATPMKPPQIPINPAERTPQQVPQRFSFLVEDLVLIVHS